MKYSGKYSVLDSGNLQKLEQVGEHRLIRPALNAFWEPSLSPREWDKAQGVFTRNSSGGGDWKWKNGGVPDSWIIEWNLLKLIVKPTGFGHLGFFAEQSDNWDWLRNTVSSLQKPVTAINMFAYSGGSSLAMASAGAEVCHLDAAKGMNDWGKLNLEQNPDIPSKIRWITDDVIKFTDREIKRKRKYNGIVLDPPSFGRGSQKQIWKIEDSIVYLLKSCRKLIDLGNPYFVLFTCHSPGFTPVIMSRILTDVFTGNCKTEHGEMIVEEETGKMLSAGAYVRLLGK